MKPYQKLRGLLRAEGIDQKELAHILGCSTTSVSHKFMGKYPWSSDQMYKIMDILDKPYNLLHEVFPKNGTEKKTLKAHKVKLFIVKAGKRHARNAC
jgi:predicted transcriptional regulator